MLRPLFAPPLFFCLLLAPSLSQGEKPLKKEASPSADRHVRPTRLPRLKTCLLALLLAFCLGPGLSRAEGLFIVEPGLPEPGRPLQIAPLTDAKTGIPPAVIRAAAIYREKRTADAAAFCEQALIGDLDVLFALSALSRLDEAEQRPPRFGAPAAFWEDWAVRLLGEREAWYRIAVAGSKLVWCDDGLTLRGLLPLEEAALRKAAALGHPEAMYSLALFANYKVDPAFRLPEKPEFAIPPASPEAAPEYVYWLGAAAANGSAEACHAIGYLYSRRHSPAYDKRKAGDYFLRAARLGSPAAMAMLARNAHPLDRDGWFSRSECQASYTYHLLWQKMDSTASTDLPLDAMLHGGTERFPQACLTRAAYEEAWRQAEEEFAAIRIAEDEKEAARDALYEKARPLFAELRAAFAAQATEQTSPAGAGR